MQTYRLALIGFGNVAQGFTQIIRDRGDLLASQYGLRLEITAVSDLRFGNVYDPQGLNPASLLLTMQTESNLENFPAAYRGWSTIQTIADTNADVVVETTYTDLETGEPAIDHVRQAIEAGKHVVTTNKGPIALMYPGLRELAEARGVEIGAEGTVMSGTPALRLGGDWLRAAGLSKIEGILNGTTNYILTRMEAGASYLEALSEAQDRGFAEADPSGDVEGYDAAGKVVILGNLLMGSPLKMEAVERQGITELTAADIDQAHKSGERWKLIGLLEKYADGVKASVKPQRLPLSHPLASISGATNAIKYTTELLGEITLIGPGAGRMETGYALVQDLLAIHRKLS